MLPPSGAELNLQGQLDAASGESRRNENIQFNPIDNNAIKELNVRMGTTATIINQFEVTQNYFGAEFGRAVPAPIHLSAAKSSGIHGNVYESHNNSIFSARSFFQAGSVKPAHTNEYGFQLGSALWRDGFLSVTGSQQRIRGSVNGNVLVPTLEERTPLTNDPDLRRFVERVLAAYPSELPNRTDISAHALNTNSPQSIDTDDANIRLDQYHQEDRFTLQYHFTNQKVLAFELVAGQNPDTDTKAHNARVTWSRAWNAVTTTNFTAGFDRLRTLIVPEPNSWAHRFRLAVRSINSGRLRTCPSTVPRISSATPACYCGSPERTRGARVSRSCAARSMAANTAASAASSLLPTISAATP